MITRLLPLILFLWIVPTLEAQPDVATRIPAAETSFQNGLERYEIGNFEEAYRLFTRAATEFGYNDRTTAAMLMAGKSAYADGNAELAISTMTSFLRLYPNSRYAEEAEAVRSRALRTETEVEPFKLGVILPATGESGYLAQALFNGVRLAVDGYNNRAPATPVQLVFRDSEGSDIGAQAAMGLVAREGVEVVIGPLFSQEALAAADIAERQRIVLLAPLATDREVAMGRRYVFQVNPTFEMRGRAMGRFVTRRLGMTRLAVVSGSDSYGSEMAAGFASEVASAGATLVISEELSNAASWSHLHELSNLRQLGLAEAVYLPVTGSDAAQHAADALRGLEAIGVLGMTRALGNTEWEGLNASRDRASEFQTLFTQDFNVDDDASTDFVRRYIDLSGIQADRLALIGYDAARFLLEIIQEGSDNLAQRIRSAEHHRGLAHTIDFGGGQVNQSLFIMAYEDGEAVLIE